MLLNLYSFNVIEFKIVLMLLNIKKFQCNELKSFNVNEFKIVSMLMN